MKSRVLLPVSITAVAVAAVALVFCRKSEEAVVKNTPAVATPRNLPRPSPILDRTESENSNRLETKRRETKAEPEKVLTPEEEERAAAKKAQTMYKWFITLALDKGGAFPPDTSALMSKDIGFPTNDAGEWLRHVVEYRGRDLTTSDDGRLLVMRYRIGKRTDKEVRLYISGKVEVVPSTDPIPEDATPPPEAPR